jgi:hypothetical protein
MALRLIAVAAVAGPVLLGCASAGHRAHVSARERSEPDPLRFERSACLRGDYPPELDAVAFARARVEDLGAQREGAPSDATGRLLEARSDFERRCQAWRDEAMIATEGRPALR